MFTLNSQCKRALKSIVQYCTHLTALEPLLYTAPNNILKHVLCQFSKVSLFQFWFTRWRLPGLRCRVCVFWCVCPPFGGAALRQQSSPAVRHQRGAEESARNQSWPRVCDRGVHQQHQRLFLWRNHQVGNEWKTHTWTNRSSFKGTSQSWMCVCFRFYTPDYVSVLLEQIEDHQWPAI